MQHRSARTRHDTLVLALATLCLLLTGSVMRGLMLWCNSAMAPDIPTADILFSFIVGLRFDLVIACYTVLPLCLPLALPGGLGSPILAGIWLGVASWILSRPSWSWWASPTSTSAEAGICSPSLPLTKTTQDLLSSNRRAPIKPLPLSTGPTSLPSHRTWPRSLAP